MYGPAVSVIDQVDILGLVPDETDWDRTRRTVALFRDYDLGFIMCRFAFRRPCLVFRRAFRRLLKRQIVLLAIKKDDDVRVLLDRAAFAQIRKGWALVLALFNRPAQLRQGNDRHMKFPLQGLLALG